MPNYFFKGLFCFVALSLQFSLSGQIDKAQLLTDLEVLSSDEYGGRATEDNEKARNYLLGRLEGAPSAYLEVIDTFGFLDFLKKQHTGHNVVVKIRGSKYPEHYLVLSAHYDHLGTRDSKIYNGADDNASGTAALLSLFHHFQQNPPRHSIIFAFFDAEELGLKGADRFVEDPPVELDKILLNINLDMISRNNQQTINICGTYDFPKLNAPMKKVIKESALTITKMHEGPEAKGADNWTMSSDHGMFFRKGIPYLYFGVEDHPGYHKPEDDFEFITPEFYHQVTVLIKNISERFDQKLRKKRRI